MSSKLRLLVVDDDDLILQTLRMSLPSQWTMKGVTSPGEIPQDQHFHAAFVDIHLSPNRSERQGLEVLFELNEKHPHIESVAMSGDLDRQLMESGLKSGASRFLAKPLNPDEVALTLSKIEGMVLLQEASARGRWPSVQWVGESKASLEIKKQIAQLRGESGPILIEGESGTGKEVVSHIVHEQAEQGPWIQLNVAAIPDNLFESELFGHLKGSFTGAVANKMGLAEAAHDGDLFLDEIETLPLHHQAKLLRFLESGEVRPVGSDKSKSVNVRVIAATNRNLTEMVKAGEFREDLLWRLRGKKISLPPLRERKEDIADLCEYFFNQDTVRNKTLEADAVSALQSYNWPGNVRELKRICEDLLIKSPLPIVRLEDVRLALPQGKGIQSANSNAIFDDYSMGLSAVVEKCEARVIEDCLNAYRDVDKVTELLKISRSNLYKKIKEYSIDWRDQ